MPAKFDFEGKRYCGNHLRTLMNRRRALRPPEEPAPKEGT